MVLLLLFSASLPEAHLFLSLVLESYLIMCNYHLFLKNFFSYFLHRLIEWEVSQHSSLIRFNKIVQEENPPTLLEIREKVFVSIMSSNLILLILGVQCK